MKPFICLCVGLAMVSGCALPLAHAPKFGAFGLDPSAGDHTVRPGDDFDRYANGHWLSTYQLNADQAGVSVFDTLIDESEEHIKKLVDELQTRADVQPGSDEQKIRDLYASAINTAQRDAAGLTPLHPLLARYAAMRSMSDLAAAFGSAEIDAGNTPIGIGLAVDRKNPNRSLVTISVSGLGLPDREYYLDESSRRLAIRKAYLAHIELLLGYAGYRDGQQRAEAIWALETALAKCLWPTAERRNVDRTYNVIQYSALATTYPTIDWDRLFAARGFSRPEQVNVLTPSALEQVVAVVSATPLTTWRDWLTYHAINGNASALSQTLEDASFDFYGRVIEGQPEQRARWRRAIDWVADRSALGDAVGRLYVTRSFPPESKRVMETLVEDLRAAMRSNLEHAEWLDSPTRAEALRKLQSLHAKIGYPTRWRDYSSLVIVPDDLFANARALRQFYNDDLVRRIGKPPDRAQWRTTPQTPNAYHYGPFNELVFPAAILQPPLFDANADAAVNFGAIGAFIGHEMGHAFDDQGSKFDAAGQLRNWWSDTSRERFRNKGRQLAAQVATYCPLPGRCLNPELTIGENLGDLAGVSTALAAYKRSLHGRPAPVLHGLTGEQRFFLSFAQMWRTLKRDAALESQLADDPHPPAKYRINGTLRNVDAWYDAFGVKAGNALYLAPEQRVRLW